MNVPEITPRRLMIYRMIRYNAREIILRDFRADSCIASTRIITKALRRFGINAQPLVVTAQLFNRQYLDRVNDLGRFPETVAEVEEWEKINGAWSVGIGFPIQPGETLKPGGWAGHMIAYIDDDRLMIDASLDQGDRPERDIKAPSVLIAHAERPFKRGRRSLTIALDAEGGKGIVVYKAAPRNPFPAASPDWAKAERCKPAIDELIRRVRDVIE